MGEGTSKEARLFSTGVGEMGEQGGGSIPAVAGEMVACPHTALLGQAPEHTRLPPSRPEELAPAGYKGTASCHSPSPSNLPRLDDTS